MRIAKSTKMKRTLSKLLCVMLLIVMTITGLILPANAHSYAVSEINADLSPHTTIHSENKYLIEPTGVPLAFGETKALPEQHFAPEGVFPAIDAISSEIENLFAPDGIFPVFDELSEETELNFAPEGVFPTFDYESDVDEYLFAPDGTLPAPSLETTRSLTSEEVLNSSLITVQYRSNLHTGGIVPESHSQTAPSSVTLKQSGTLTRTGYIFGGWRDSAGNVYPENFTWTQASGGNFIFDAVWVQNILTIQYRSTGHTSGSVPLSHTHDVPSSVTLSQPGTLARTGYTFGGWRDTSGNVYPAGFTWTATSRGSLRFDAVWVSNEITVQYRSSGHTSGSVPQSHTQDMPSSVILSQPGTLARTGYVFGGWRDPSGNVYPAGFAWTPTSGGTVTFDAVWTLNRITIQYRSTGHTSGFLPFNHSHNLPATVRLSKPDPLARTGYAFGGWRDADGNVFPAGFTWTPTSPGTLVFDAVWIQIRVTIQYRGNNHTGGTVPIGQYDLASPVTLEQPGTMTRTGYTFGGWSDHRGMVYPAGFTWAPTSSGTFIFDAVWNPDATYSATINNFFDTAYPVFYSQTQSDGITNINSANNWTDGVFLRQFNLNIDKDHEPQLFVSTADLCKINRGLEINATTIEQLCPGGHGHSPTCTDALDMYRDFIGWANPNNDLRASVLWSGNRLTWGDGNGNRSFKWYNNGVFMINRPRASARVESDRFYLLHELAHIYSAPDHYCQNETLIGGSCGIDLCWLHNPGAGRIEECTMGRYIGNISSWDEHNLFCIHCRSAIFSRLNDSHRN